MKMEYITVCKLAWASPLRQWQSPASLPETMEGKKAGDQTQPCLYPAVSNRRSSKVLCLAPKHREGMMDVPTGLRPSCGCQHLCGHIHRCLGLTVKPVCSIPRSTSCFSPPNASTPSTHTKLHTVLLVVGSKVLPGAVGRQLVSLTRLFLTCRKEE